MKVHRLNESHDHSWEHCDNGPRRCWCMATHPEDRIRRIEIDLPAELEQQDVRDRFSHVVTRDRFFVLARNALVEPSDLSILDYSLQSKSRGLIARVLYRGPAIGDAQEIE